MESKAIARYIKISPRKAGIVANAVRGKNVGTALNILKFSNLKAAKLIDKVVRSAVANAENNYNMDVDSLFIKRICVDQGPRLKRFMPRAMGRATKILKPSSHITIILDEK